MRWPTLLAVLLLCSIAGRAEVSTDGTLGNAVDLPGPDFVIGADLGQQLGGNLFHSFSRFNIDSGESANFTGPGSVQHILSRITDGTASSIDGLVRSDIAGADLWLINPAGVIFGSNATLDLPGALHVSSADYLRLGDGGRFDASVPANSLLTAAPPTAFGFVDNNIAAIRVDAGQLRVSEGESLSLVGGELGLDGAAISAPGGRINLAATASAGEIGLDMSGVGSGADISLNNASVLAQAETGGSIYIIGGRFVVSGDTAVGSDSLGDETSSGTGGEIAVDVDSLSLSGNSFITASTYGAGDSASIRVEAGELTMADNSQIAASTQGSGRSGDISIEMSDSLLLRDSSNILNFALAGGDAGDIQLNASQITLDGGFVQAAGFADGGGGDLFITANNLNMVNAGDITVATLGASRGGDLDIHVAGTLLIDGGESDGFNLTTGIGTNSQGTGDAGALNLVAGELDIRGGFLSSATTAAGRSSDILIQVDELSLTGNGGIFSNVNVNSTGDGGSLVIEASGDVVIAGDVSGVNALVAGAGRGSDVLLSAGGQITFDTVFDSITTRAISAGDSGDVVVQTPHLLINSGGIAGTTSSSGAGGDILIQVDTLETYDFAEIVSEAFSSAGNTAGDGGSIRIEAAVSAILQGISEVSTSSLGAGNAGDITIISPLVRVEGADIAAEVANSPGNPLAFDSLGGDIVLEVDNLVLDGGSISTATSFDTGDAGNIFVNASGDVDIFGDFGGIDSGAFIAGTGNAGDITINAANLRLTETEISSGSFNSQDPTDGGDITISVDNLQLIDGAGITAAAEFGGGGDAGAISIFAANEISLVGTDPTGFQLGSAISSESVDGKAGAISLTAATLLVDQGRIQAGTTGVGQGAAIDIAVDNLSLIDGGEITSESFGAGDGGPITIVAQGQILIDTVCEFCDSISARSFSILEGGGKAGDITLSATSLDISGGEINAETGTSGDGGAISVDVDTLELRDGARINVKTTGQGSAGAITVNADSIAISGENPLRPFDIVKPSGLFATASDSSGGDAGNILVQAGNLTLFDGGQILSDSGSTGRGGDIRISGDNVELSGGALISAVSTGTGNAGNVDFDLGDTLELRDSAIRTSAALSAGGDINVDTVQLVHLLDSEVSAEANGVSPGDDGGNVRIAVPGNSPDGFIVLNSSDIIARANAGNGGNILLSADQLVSSPDSVVDASSRTGIDGEVSIEAPSNELSGTLTTLDAEFIDLDELLKNPCTISALQGRSSFVVQTTRPLAPPLTDYRNILLSPDLLPAGADKVMDSGATTGPGWLAMIDCSGESP